MSEIIFSKEYCSNVFDGTHDSPKPCEIGVPLITSKNIVNGCLDFNGAYNISLEDYNKIQKRSAVSKWDIIFSMIGSVGEVYLEKNDNINYAIKNVGVLSCKDEYKAKWLYYYLKTPFAKSYIKYSLAGAVQKFLSLGKLRDFPIFQYDITKNKNLDFLSALDDKIELNNRINAELEAMAKTLYDYWFVQFDFPVASTGSATEISRENVASTPLSQQSDEKNAAAERSRGYKSSGGKMVYNETLKREIPEGWEVKNLFEVCNVQYGFPFSTEYFNEIGHGIPVIRIRDIVENSVSNYSTEKNVDSKYEILKGDLLVGMDGNFHINYWTKNNCYLNQRVVKLTEKELPNIYLRYQIEPYIKAREASVSRTTVGHLSDKDLKAINVLVPPKEIKLKIKNIYSDVLNKIITNKEQNQELSALRDWLLPMLMNGQVKVG